LLQIIFSSGGISGLIPTDIGNDELKINEEIGTGLARFAEKGPR
jgi:hypothetical protein